MTAIIATVVGVIISFFILIALMLHSFVDDELAEIEIQKMIEKGYLNTDYTTEELANFCLTYYNVLWQEDLTNTCFWFL